ncbi:MAG: ATP-binding cassette domain-containing protein [Candidatus Eisenbacteria bacterium]|nr:ATP-binding cassette domain-containing protein [Candidatus Eisenbacteria bacterium]
MDVGAGEIIAIVGPSGVGKSTLLHIMGALDRPTTGSVRIDGVDVFDLPDARVAAFRNRTIGFVFQFHHLMRELSAVENVMMPCLIAGRSRPEARERASELLGRVGLSERADHLPGELSGGEEQRVAVARALAVDPLVVLADEPSGNLDRAGSEELHDLIWELRDSFGQTFVIVTHNRSLSSRADRVVVLRDGLVVDAEREVSGAAAV